MARFPYEDICKSMINSGNSRDFLWRVHQFSTSSVSPIRRFSCRNPFVKPRTSALSNPSYVRQRAEWAFMNETDPDQRSEARDGALARLRPAYGRLLRRGRGPVQRADSP